MNLDRVHSIIIIVMIVFSIGIYFSYNGEVKQNEKICLEQSQLYKDKFEHLYEVDGNKCCHFIVNTDGDLERSCKTILTFT